MTRNPEVIGPSSSFFVSHRMRLHYVDWGNEGAPPLLLIHGGRDHARSWDWVARELRREYHVIAPDLRGHGDSAWSTTASYSYPDYVVDLAQLTEVIGRFPVRIIGHSLGGGISLYFTGSFPERVERLVCVEGFFPPTGDRWERPEPAPERIRKWVEHAQGLAHRQPRRYPSIEEAAKRMRQENAFLTEEQARHLTVHGVARNEDGTYSWKFDNYMRGRDTEPSRFTKQDVEAILGNIACPVLLIRGSQGWTPDPTEGGQLNAFRDARTVAVDDAEHWVHHDQLEPFVEQVRKFLA